MGGNQKHQLTQAKTQPNKQTPLTWSASNRLALKIAGILIECSGES